MKDWQMGYPIEFLQEIASIFKVEMKPYTYGAFGLPKENTVAMAHSKGHLAFTKNGGDEIRAACIFNIAKSHSEQIDFSRTQVAVIPKGDLSIKAVAGTSAAVLHLLQGLEIKSKAPSVWIEAHEENGQLVNLLRSVGFNKVLTKVAASSEIKGLYHRGETTGRMPAPLAREDAPGLKCLIKSAISKEEHRMMRAELRAYEASEPWAQHYSTYNKRQSWTAFALQGFGDPGFIIKPVEMSKKWKEENPDRLKSKCQPTMAFAHFPRTMATLQRLGIARAERIRFMQLAAKGGELTRHADITDPDAGTAEGKLCRLHIPLVTQPGCEFRSWDLEGRENRMHLHEAGLFYLDTRKPHAVVNDSESTRVHLVIDACSSSKLRELINA